MFWKAVFVVAVFALSQDVASAMVGGYRDAKLSDLAVQDALQFAVAKHNEGTNNIFLRQVSNVISVQTQLVNGMNYKFVVEMGLTACRKTGVETECPVHSDAGFAMHNVCTFVVYKQWSGTIKMTSQSCS